MEDEKEAAEHATIVDLIRNDLSQVATDVRVDRYRFIEQTEQGKVFKAGGGITSKSDCHKEYEEVIQKVYLPIIGIYK